MINVNSKYLNDLQYGSLQSHHHNEVTEESGCATVMGIEGGEINHLPIGFLLSGSLTNVCTVTPLVILSMLESASGYETNLGASSYCALSSSICNLISINESESDINYIINISNPHLENETEERFIESNIPLVISSEDLQNNNISDWMSAMAKNIYGYYLDFTQNLEGLEVETTDDHIFCHDNIHRLCDEEHNRNTTISDRCCPTITKYIKDIVYPTTPHPTTPSTTMESIITTTKHIKDIVYSTTPHQTTPSTTMESIITTPTEIPDNNYESICIAVLVLFLSISVAALYFVGHKIYTTKMETHQPQNVSQADEINEEETFL
ncbi:hypothetical protein [Candidatus Ichthyocystis hellenicum]|uniref:hypothetical protein n=1 Tax=Candidatus Ichthyocystis hellenicum TaxID=1561003 RepID=UPI000B885B33|nr:hypothetical protein [Candidatus Ichthyocystis hellenicum]